jgi:hypothetical protein
MPFLLRFVASPLQRKDKKDCPPTLAQPLQKSIHVMPATCPETPGIVFDQSE